MVLSNAKETFLLADSLSFICVSYTIYNAFIIISNSLTIIQNNHIAVTNIEQYCSY